MGPGGVVMLLVPGQDGAQCAWFRMRVWSRSSRRRVPIRRSQIAFIRGACTAVRTMVVPAAWNTASKDAVKFEPRSRIRKRKSPDPLAGVGGGGGGGPAPPPPRRGGGGGARGGAGGGARPATNQAPTAWPAPVVPK